MINKIFLPSELMMVPPSVIDEFSKYLILKSEYLENQQYTSAGYCQKSIKDLINRYPILEMLRNIPIDQIIPYIREMKINIIDT